MKQKQDSVKGEKEFVANLNSQITEAINRSGKHEIVLQVGPWKKTVTGASRVERDGKAVVCDLFAHHQGAPQFYFSHKKENYSERGYGRPPSSETLHPMNRHTDPRWVKYAIQVRGKVEELVGKSQVLDPWSKADVQGYYSEMPKDLKIKAVFGNEAVEGNEFGWEFVHAIIKGNVELIEQSDGSFLMKGNVHAYPDVPSGEDEPLMLFHAPSGKSDRKKPFRFNDGTILYGWMGIFPRVCFSKKSKSGKPSGRCKNSLPFPLIS